MFTQIKPLGILFLFLFSFTSTSWAQQELTVNLPTLEPFVQSGPLRITYRAVVDQATSENVTQLVNTARVTGENFDDALLPDVVLPLFFTNFTLINPAYAFWNGFLQMQNVLALINKDEAPISGTVALYGSNGDLRSTTALTIPAHGEIDLVVNGLPGFNSEDLGLVRVEFDRSVFDGNMMYYRFSPLSSDALEFSLGGLLQNPLFGESFALFNTMQPSRRPGQEDYEVSNWLQLANLDEETTVTFTVEFYSQEGDAIQSVAVTVPPLSRRDIAAGHVVPGKNNVGMLRIVPNQTSARYLAQLSRYGASGPFSGLAKFFYFAQTIEARTASSRENLLPLSREGLSENWLVIGNPAETPGSYTIELFAYDGSTLGGFTLGLNPREHLHIFANTFLGASTAGAVRISPLTGSTFVAESNVYFNDSSNLETTAAYGIASLRTLGSTIDGSYNTFLGQTNSLNLFNSNSVFPTVFGFTLYSPTAPLGTGSVSLDPLHGSELFLSDLGFGPPADFYGAIQVNGPAGELTGSVLRLQTIGPRTEAAELLPLR